MNILSFIVMEENMGSYSRKVSYTITGENYIPCGKPVPVIVKGKGCIGIGIVESLLITSTSTKIEFSLNKDISKAKKEAYYDLYKTDISVGGSSSDDPYETDVVIPGAMARKTPRREPSSNYGIGLTDIASQYGDYDDWN